MNLSRVAIIGRPNVGKSSLLNKLAGRRISIVDPRPGVTRDRVTATVRWDGREFEIVDTGGVGIVDEENLSSHISQQIELAVQSADLILFLVDAKDGITALDREIAERIRRLERIHLLVANKCEGRYAESSVAEFFQLGLGDPFMVSVKTGVGLDDLLDRTIAELKRHATESSEGQSSREVRLAVVGRRNAGKSTLVNLLAGEERVIVSEIPGTTRDAVDVRIHKEGFPPFTVIDTAGIRKKKSIQDSVEFFSLTRSSEAVRRSDVVLLLFDCETEISEVDKKLARYIVDHHKPCIIVASKWDLGRASTEKFQEYIYGKLPLLAHAPIAFLSAKEGLNVWETIRLALDLFEQAGRRVSTADLNRALEAARNMKLPSVGGQHPKIYYGTQTHTHPPTMVLFVNETKYFRREYDRFLQNRLREFLPFPEIPIRILYRKREQSAPRQEKIS